MDDIAEIAHQLAVAFGSQLREPASLRMTVYTHGLEGRTFDAAGRPARIGGQQGVSELLARLRAAVGVEKLFVELSATPPGDYTLTYSASLPSFPVTLVLDPGYRYPGHPAPGMPRPASARPDDRPTDPRVRAEIAGLVAAFIQEYARIRGTAPDLGPGHTEAEIAAAEQRMGLRLPEAVRALYLSIHADPRECGLLGLLCPAPLRQVATWYATGDPGSAAATHHMFANDPVVYETRPYGRVRRVARSDWWVTFAPDGGMNFGALDLDPADGGTAGQIVLHGRDVYGPVVYVAPSVAHVLRSTLAAMRRTKAGRRWPVDQPDTRPGHAWSAALKDGSLAEKVVAHPDPDAVQSVHLDEAGTVALRELGRFRHLRTIVVRRLADYVDLSIADSRLIEQVVVYAKRFEPERLASVATLRYLTLGGNTEPVSIAPLAELPGLIRVDLSDAEIADIGALAGFSAVRVLTLNPAQWRDLLATGWRPDRLAGAGLGGQAGIADAAEWLGVTGVGPGDDYHILRGRI